MKKISVIGAGTMGNGIAHVFALSGFEVALIDIAQERLDKALATIRKNMDRQVQKGTASEQQVENALERLHAYTALEEGCEGVSLVVEAATEHVETKLGLFRQLDKLAPAHAILATNTSSISITKIAAVTQRPDKVVGMHFMNPVPVMKLVEVINGYLTSQETTAAVVAATEQLGKIPVTANDYPGFVANRILMPMINEAIYTLYTGVAGVSEIDQIMKLGMAHPMGPLLLADFIGLDVCMAIMQVLHQGLGDSKYAPCPLLVNMVTAGHLGAKSGMGFYNWSTDAKNPDVAPQFK